MKKTTYTKSDLVNAVYDKIGYNKKISEDLVNDMFNFIKCNLQKGQGFKFHGFGNFILKDKLARKGRNPKTGKVLTVSARRVLLFHASSVLKKKFN